VRGRFQQAAEIQQSLLLEEAPAFAGYSIACRSVPTEEVGGDFYDFVSLGEGMLGIAIGDASGHGLPAALLVRDVVTGLRMGIEKDLKIAPVFERLNRVVHRSNLTSRFVSVFYGELAANGNLIYVNAGHQPPLLFSNRGIESLDIGGTVVGPLPEVAFERGVIRVPRDSTLLMCTDGILERRGADGEFFGEERLVELVGRHRREEARDVVDRVYSEVWEFGGGRAWEDDATLVIVRRLS
jgi:sigma-B regulation protein RsbU (phosphoserine phosphatase)